MRSKFLLLGIVVVFSLLMFSCSDSSTESEIRVATPVFNPPGGSYSMPQTVTIACDTEGAVIYYTTDGSDPTESSIEYSSPVWISADMTLKARAYKEDWASSSIASAVYAITIDFDAEWSTVPAGDYIFGEEGIVRNIDYDYEIMKYDVTNAQYLEFLQSAYEAGTITVENNSVMGHYPGDGRMPEGEYGFYSLGEISYMNTARISYEGGEFRLNYPDGFSEDDYLEHPVVYVSWIGAWAFARHYGLRLPTEHEWEKAARGTTGNNFPWGNELDGSFANYWNSGDPWDNGTTPAGYFDGSNPDTSDSQSPYGVYDMAGNVWNWTNSWVGAGDSNRVLKGGSWNSYETTLNSWFRHNGSPPNTYYNTGFRCVNAP